MNKKVRLIITDLDQTFLKTDKSISKFSLDVMKRCREQGIYIAIATARSEQAAAKYIDLIKPDIVISNGGALVKYKDSIIYQCMLSAPISDLLIKDCMKNSSVGEITVETENAYYSNGEDLNSEDLNKSSTDYSHTKYNDYTQPLNCMAYKITVEIFDHNVAIKLASKYPECSFLGFTGEKWYRFAHSDATKINAVNELIKHLNISLEQVAAFGDDFNDIEMIRCCGYGVAVSNAIKEVLKSASYITGSNDEDGVAQFINENFLL